MGAKWRDKPKKPGSSVLNRGRGHFLLFLLEQPTGIEAKIVMPDDRKDGEAALQNDRLDAPARRVSSAEPRRTVSGACSFSRNCRLTASADPRKGARLVDATLIP